jgi:adiponectin receptor
MVCLLTSATCHLFGCCSAHVTAVMWRFDYAGIAVLIVASFFPTVHYGELAGGAWSGCIVGVVSPAGCPHVWLSQC